MIDTILTKIEDCICTQFENGIETIDTIEMGQVADIFKDLWMAKYYYTVVEAMENSDYSAEDIRDMDYPKKMYFSEPIAQSTVHSDKRLGRSGAMRKTYMESKEIHGNSSDEMENLEKFLNTLDADMTELYPNMTAAEKQMTKNKLQAMINKVM